MPTGYTDMIDRDPNMTAKKWILEGLSRAFGICVTLRDDPMDYDEAKIRELIVKRDQESVDYCLKNVKEAREKLDKHMRMTEEEWKDEWLKHEGMNDKDNMRSIKTTKDIETRHNAIKADLEKVLASNAGEITKNIAGFGIEQLKLVEDETHPYKIQRYTFDEYKKNHISEYIRNVEYHTEETKKAIERRDDRLREYDKLRQDVKEILG